MTPDLLRNHLTEAGYALRVRSDEWTECFASRANERWRGVGLDEDDALEDVVRQMFPSTIARELLVRHLRSRAENTSVYIAPPLANGVGEHEQPHASVAPQAGASDGDAPPPAASAAPSAEATTPANSLPTADAAPAANSSRIRAAARNDRSLIPERNEDACLVLAERGLVAVAGGLGAPAVGAAASTMAIETLRGAFDSKGALSPVRTKGLPMLLAAIERANGEVYKSGRRDPARREMATTVAAALVVGRQVVLAHVGDSRVYRFRRGVLGLLTTDHSVRNQRIRSGKPVGTKGGDVTRALGARRTVEVETSVATSQPGDVLLLCTAGIHGVVGHEDLAELLGQHRDPEAAVEHLVARANALGGPGDATAAVVRWER